MARPPRWTGAIVPVLLLALWELSARGGAAPEYLPAPSIILAQMGAMLASGELLFHAAVSLYRALSAFAIGALCGAAVGLAAGTLGSVERFYEPIISLTYPVPKVAALPIVFAWFGLGDISKIVIITISVVLLNASTNSPASRSAMVRSCRLRAASSSQRMANA